MYLFGLGGPLQNDTQPFVPVSNDVVDEAKLPVFWGDPVLQGLHIGFFVALAALVVYWLVLNRTTLGYEVRAVGFNPEAARYGGITVARNYFLAMAISGAFAGLAGAIDIARLAVPHRHERHPGLVHDRLHRHRRRAARPEHGGRRRRSRRSSSPRCTTGTSTRNLDPEIFRPELAGEPDH